MELDKLKAGDPVAWVQRAYVRPEAYTGTVTRLTPTQFVVTGPRENVYRFRRSDGRMVGQGGLHGRPTLLDVSDPEVILLRRNARVRGAARDIVTLANALDPKNYAVAEDQLTRIIDLATNALSALWEGK